MLIHLIAIGGAGMAPLACLLRELGHQVRGSDGPLYPPTSELLADAGIEPLVGYDPAHLEPRPDLVIVGNAVPRTNPEAVATEELGLPRLSMPEALDRFVLRDRRPLVIAGSHGKTTTTAMAAWVYSRAGADPGFLIGGAPIGLASGFALGGGPRFAIEGDEYNASYFDRGPKFWHYRPETLVVTSLEHDHVDLYPDFDGLERAFLGLVERLPPSGLLIACADYPAVERLTRASPCRVVTYGAGAGDVRLAGPVESGENGISFELEEAGARQRIELGVWGEHNAANATAVWIAARADGLDPRGRAGGAGYVPGRAAPPRSGWRDGGRGRRRRLCPPCLGGRGLPLGAPAAVPRSPAGRPVRAAQPERRSPSVRRRPRGSLGVGRPRLPGPRLPP